jgi:hypothetical protein
VDCVYDDSVGEDTALTLGDPSGPQVRLWNRVDPWSDGSVRICAQLVLPGADESLTATSHDITVGVAEEQLSTFLDGLAEAFTGWENVRTWKTLSQDLRIDAEYFSGGYTDLTWTLSSRPHGRRSKWSASVTMRIEAGQQMRRLTAAMYRFLNSAEQY